MMSNSEWQERMRGDSRRFWLQHAKNCCKSAARCEYDSVIVTLLGMALVGLARSK